MQCCCLIGAHLTWPFLPEKSEEEARDRDYSLLFSNGLKGFLSCPWPKSAMYRYKVIMAQKHFFRTSDSNLNSYVDCPNFKGEKITTKHWSWTHNMLLYMSSLYSTRPHQWHHKTKSPIHVKTIVFQWGICFLVAKAKVIVTFGTPIFIKLWYIKKMAKIITAPDYRVIFVKHLYFDYVTFEMAGVTLRNGSRSNGWYME